MLRRAREADNPTNQGVVAAVSPCVHLGEQLVEAMRRNISGTGRYIDPEGPQARSGHAHHQ
jgi:hypothetical protein